MRSSFSSCFVYSIFSFYNCFLRWGWRSMQSSLKRLISQSGLVPIWKRLSSGNSLVYILRGRSCATSQSIFRLRFQRMSALASLSLSLLKSLRCMRQPCMYSLSIFVFTRFSQPSSNTSCLLTNLYQSQTTLLCSSYSSSVMLSTYGTHFGPGPSWGMKQHPILGYSRAARMSPLVLTTVNMLIEWSGSTLVNSLPSPLVIFICFLLLNRILLKLLSMKWIELIGSLQLERIDSNFRSKRTSQRLRTDPSPTPTNRPV